MTKQTDNKTKVENLGKIANEGTIPNLRFPEFNGEWKIRKLGEIVDFKVTNSFSRENLNCENGTVKNIHYGDIHTKFQTLFDITKEQVPFINENVSIGKIVEDNYCKEGDVIFADASEDLKDVGKSIEIVNLNDEKLLSGLHTILARPKANMFCKGFNGYLFQSNNVRFQIQKEAQGTKVLSLSSGRLSNIDLSFPTLQEQQKIASLLSLIDQNIEQSKKIIEGLTSFKSAVSKKIFSQELRFSSLDIKWEKVKLKEVCEKQSSNISANKIEDNFGDYLIYGASGKLKTVDFYEVEDDYISVVKDGAGVGRLLYCKGKSSVLGTLDIIKPKNGINPYFLYCLLLNIDFGKYITGSTIPHIYFKDYSNEIIEMPLIEEQIKIANFLSCIDQKVNLEIALLEQLKSQKQYLLQQLFI